MMTSSDGTTSQSMDSATEEIIRSIATSEFSLRRSSRICLLPDQDTVMKEPLTPDPTPRVSPLFGSTQLFQDEMMTPESASVKKQLHPTRSKRHASIVATAAMHALFTSAQHAADFNEQVDEAQQEPAFKKTKITLKVKPRYSGLSHSANIHDGHTTSQHDASSTISHSVATSASILGQHTTRSKNQATLASTANNATPKNPRTTPPRKRATLRTPRVQTIANVKPPIDRRPLPCGQPLVWADQRQALCETLPYYRAFQSGAYTNGGIAYGFLLDRDCGERAYMDEEVVITRAGGGCKANESGQMAQAEDQSSTSAIVTSFYRNMNQFVPLPLIVGAKNANCPSKIPHRYCVMDYFQITDIWAEKSNGKTCFKFRFEKIDLHTKSWWAAAGSPMPERFEARALRQKCRFCNKINPQVFQENWMCLNDACTRFWQVGGQDAPASLAYNPVFLRERTTWPSQYKAPWALRPALLSSIGRSDPHLAVSLASWKGMACPNCGRCNSRTHWDAWKCENIECGFEHTIKHTIVDPHTVLPDHCGEVQGLAVPLDKYLEPIELREANVIGDWRIHTYDMLPGNHVTHFMANDVLNNAPGGAYDMFRGVQAAEMPLQRFPLAMSAMEGESLTKHFAVNYGMPYKYIVAVSSKAFSEAPKPVMDALARLTWAGRQSVTDGSFMDFNEELVLGYFERQAIGYHDDGEKDLGPTIATLSLGGDAIMTIRLKKRYYQLPKGFSLETYDPKAEVFPGSRLYKERLEINKLHEAGDDRGYKMAKAELFKNLKKGNVNASPILTMKLRMGDMVVMHGGEMQKYFEHSIVPEGKLRFGLTCRYVNPANIPTDEHWKGIFNFKDSEIYHGDVDPTPVVVDTGAITADVTS